MGLNPISPVPNPCCNRPVGASATGGQATDVVEIPPIAAHAQQQTALVIVNVW